MRSLLIVAATFAVLALPRPAFAGEDQAALATDPVTLSEIEHDDLHVAWDTWGSSLSHASGTNAHDVAAWSTHVRVESPIASKRYYVHVEYESGSATSPTYGGSRILGGNAIVGGRAVWSHPEGMAFGGDMGVALPTSRFGSVTAQDVSLVLASMRPWDYDAFRSSAVTFMPALDARAVIGPLTLQLRHQLDVALETTNVPRSNLSTITTLYAGVRLFGFVTPGIEGAELYLIDPSVADAHRSFTVIAPGVRFNLGRLSPEIGVLTNIGEPTHPLLDQVWAFRVSCTYSFEPVVLTP